MWIGGDSSEAPFTMFSMQHWGVIAVFFAGLVVIYLLRNKSGGMNLRRWEIAVAVSVILFDINYYVWLVMTDSWDISHGLPLALSSLSVILTVVLLLTRNRLVFEILFMVGIGGAMQAIVTPVVSYGLPHFRFWHFFYTHIIVIWVVFYFLWFLRYTVTFMSVVKAMVFLNVLLPFIYLVNVVTGGNYWFIMRKPSGVSLLDFLGPHPWYVLGMQAAAVVVFTLLWLVFGEKKLKKN